MLALNTSGTAINNSGNTTISAPTCIFYSDSASSNSAAAGGSSAVTARAIAGVGGIPQSAAGAVLNVTGVGYSQYGWLTVYPNGQAVPSTSTVNFDTREYAIANGTTCCCSLPRIGCSAVNLTWLTQPFANNKWGTLASGKRR